MRGDAGRRLTSATSLFQASSTDEALAVAVADFRTTLPAQPPARRPDRCSREATSGAAAPGHYARPRSSPTYHASSARPSGRYRARRHDHRRRDRSCSRDVQNGHRRAPRLRAYRTPARASRDSWKNAQRRLGAHEPATAPARSSWREDRALNWIGTATTSDDTAGRRARQPGRPAAAHRRTCSRSATERGQARPRSRPPRRNSAGGHHARPVVDCGPDRRPRAL
mgnify:CR=1 FL=1